MDLEMIDFLGPAKAGGLPALIFEYADAFSVFDWGRMPDPLPKKGNALAVLAAELFEKLERPEIWREYSRSAEALALRKANQFGAVFNELGEELQAVGLRTHYLGVLENLPSQYEMEPKKASEVSVHFNKIAVQQVSAVRPTLVNILGRSFPDYYLTRNSPLPRLIPFEVVFRFGKWDFPALELFTKLEATDRPVPMSEALAISGLSASQLQEILLKTAWVASLLRFWCVHAGFELTDGKLEWALSKEGKCFLVGTLGPDELRISKNGVPLSKEFLGSYYQTTPWYSSVEKARSQVKAQSGADWKRLVLENPPPLPAKYRDLATQVYLALTNQLTGKKWFADAWVIDRVVEELGLI